jgi:hypothetical protein
VRYPGTLTLSAEALIAVLTETGRPRCRRKSAASRVADALLDYHDLGSTTFLRDAIGYRRDLIARRQPDAG